MATMQAQLASAPLAGRSARARPRGMSTWRGSLVPWIVPLILLVLWQGVLTLGIFKTYQLPSPLQVFAGGENLFGRGLLQQHVVATTSRVLAGFAIGGSLGVLLGITIGLSRTLDRLLDPTLQGIRTVPTLAWAPLLLLWMGIDEQPKITLVAIGAFFPVYVNVVAGVRGVDRKLVEVGRIYNLTWAQIARRIILPASLPNVLTGLRLGFSQAWLFVVVAELIASTRGLGFILNDSQNTARVDLMVLSMICLAILGKISDTLLRIVESRVLSWRDTIGDEAPSASAAR